MKSLRSSDGSELAEYQLLVESLPHLVWFAQSDGTVTYLNRRKYRYGSVIPGAGGFYDLATIVHTDDLERTELAWRRAVETGEDYECEHRVRMATGSFRWHISRASLVVTGAGEMWVGTATDTQVLAGTRDAALESEARLRSVVSSIDHGYCLCELVFDDGGRPVDYRFLETNDVFEEATGLSDAVGRTALELVPSLESHWVETYARVALGDEPLRFEQESIAMGRRFDVFATPVPPRGSFALIFADITARHAALEALHESEERFRNMADHAPVMIWITDENGSCTYLNRRWYEFTGQTEDQALGSGWLRATHPEDRERAETAFADATRQQAAFHLDYRLRRRDGSYRWAVDAATPRLSDDGRFLGFVGSVMDITERKEAEHALADQRNRDHAIAVRLQESMLPTGTITDARVEIATAYVASADFLQVGGDWFETFRTQDERIGVVVGDVVGHHIEAAAAMGQLRAGMLALASHVDDPAQLLCELDAFAQSNLITDFVTAVCLFLDPSDGSIQYASAGHPPPLICPPVGVSRWLDGALSIPLGIATVESRPTQIEMLEFGDVLVLYSDGLVERRGESLDNGFHRLAHAIESERHATMNELCDRTLRTLGSEHGFDDDTVLVTLRRIR